MKQLGIGNASCMSGSGRLLTFSSHCTNFFDAARGWPAVFLRWNCSPFPNPEYFGENMLRLI